MVLAGIIPGPHEPCLHINPSYIKPLVDKVLKLWSGVNGTTEGQQIVLL